MESSRAPNTTLLQVTDTDLTANVMAGQQHTNCSVKRTPVENITRETLNFQMLKTYYILCQ